VPDVIIQVAETHPPKAGKKLGTVKTATGESFGIWPDKLASLQVGGRYQIEFDENEFNGRTYRKITKVHPAEAAEPSAAPTCDSEQQFVSALLNGAIAAGKLPGGVLCLEHHGAAYHAAFGDRAVVPAREPMTPTTAALVSEAKRVAPELEATAA